MRRIWAIIPARNEGTRIDKAIQSAWTAGVTEVLVVDNGSSDDTRVISQGQPRPPQVLSVPLPLGPDIPRAVGAHLALYGGAETVLFLDGDMTGALAPYLTGLLAQVEQGMDLAVTDPFPYGPPTQGLAGEVNRFRDLLNQTLGWNHLGVSIMSHGPSALSRRFVATVGYRALGHPPVAMAHGARLGLRAAVGCTMGHEAMGGAGRDALHATKMAETLIGDCLQAINVFIGSAPQRCWQGQCFDGYDSERRWDWLEDWLQTTPEVPPRPYK